MDVRYDPESRELEVEVPAAQLEDILRQVVPGKDLETVPIDQVNTVSFAKAREPMPRRVVCPSMLAVAAGITAVVVGVLGVIVLLSLGAWKLTELW